MADFLEEAFPVENQVAPEPTPPAPEVTPEPVAEAPPPEPVTPEPVEPQKSDFIPIAALMDERDKRKAAEARVAEFERSQQQRQPQNAPDPLDDPEGFRQSVTADIRLEMSDRFARSRHGDEATQAAIDWATSRAQSDPSIAISFARQADPVEWLVQQHKRDALLSDIGDVSKLDDWFSREAAKRGYAPQNAPAAAAAIPAAVTPALKPVAPPASIASQVSQSAPIASDPVAEFNAIFAKR